MTAKRRSLISKEDAAEWLNITVVHLKRMRDTWVEGDPDCLGFIRVGAYIKYDPAEIERWIEHRTGRA